MSGFERKTLGSFLNRLIPVVALALCMAPSAVNAEPLLLLYNEWGRYPVPEAARPAVKRPVDVGLNDNGDLVIRNSDVSLTMAYSPPTDVIEPRERIRVAQRMDTPSISGISLKVSFPF